MNFASYSHLLENCLASLWITCFITNQWPHGWNPKKIQTFCPRRCHALRIRGSRTWKNLRWKNNCLLATPLWFWRVVSSLLILPRGNRQPLLLLSVKLVLSRFSRRGLGLTQLIEALVSHHRTTQRHCLWSRGSGSCHQNAYLQAIRSSRRKHLNQVSLTLWLGRYVLQ